MNEKLALQINEQIELEKQLFMEVNLLLSTIDNKLARLDLVRKYIEELIEENVIEVQEND